MTKKVNKKQTVKGKSAKASAKKSTPKKTKIAKAPAKVTKKMTKPTAKPASKGVKKLVAKAVKPIAAAKRATAVPKKAASAVDAAKPAAKVTKSRKKMPKLDKKIARILVKIASSQKTAVATVGVQSAAMAAVRATVAMAAAANTNHPAANQSAPAAKAAPVPAKPVEAAKPAFKAGDVVVYPAHGVGKVDGVEAHTIGGAEVRLFRITFDHERMTLKVPVARANGSGLRQLSSKETMKNVFETMKGRPRVRRVMWSRRAQEYEQKINSGDPVAIAEVLRDLRRNAESGDQSYSERQIFQTALERLAREVAAIERVEHEVAVQKLSDILIRKPVAANNDNADAA